MDQEKKDNFKTVGVIAVVLFTAGFAIGVWLSVSYFDIRMRESVQMQRMVYNKTVYDLMPFDKTLENRGAK